MKGKIKWFNSKKGFGFIEGEDGQDYFVHYSEVPNGVFLRENDEVNFEAAETDKGKQAKAISLAGKGDAPADEEPAEEPAGEVAESEEGETPEEVTDSEDF
jgi:cold shock protein